MNLTDNINQVNSDFQAIKTAITNNGVVIEDGTRTSQYGEKVNEVYEQGKQSAYDEFWDKFQINGNRTNYQYGICGHGWTLDTFKPKYSVKPTHANGIFLYCGVIADLGQLFKDRGLILDFSQCTNSDQMFLGSYFTALPVLDFRKVTTTSYGLFNSCTRLKKIELIMLNINGNQQFSASFNSCSALTDIAFSGVIGQTLNMQWSPLNRVSIMGRALTSEQYENLTENDKLYNVITINGVYYYGGIIPALKSDATGKTLTLKKSAVNEAFGINVDDEATYPEGSEYYTLRHSKDNWTISYV